MVAPTGLDRLSTKDSVGSATASLAIATATILVVSPGANVSVPEVEVKSPPATAVPFAVE